MDVLYRPLDLPAQDEQEWAVATNRGVRPSAEGLSPFKQNRCLRLGLVKTAATSSPHTPRRSRRPCRPSARRRPHPATALEAAARLAAALHVGRQHCAATERSDVACLIACTSSLLIACFVFSIADWIASLSC